MASLMTSSQRSSSSYRSSSRYSASSSYRSDGSQDGSSHSLFEPFIDSAKCSGLFGEGGPGGPDSLPHFSTLSRPSSGPPGGAVTSWPSGAGSGPGCLADSYCMTADLRQFEPHDVVVMAYGHHVVVHAQRVLDDGSVGNTFTRKTSFPEDMDPLSLSGTLNPEGTLRVTVCRTTEALGPARHSKADL
ncbi:PREDICTED: heat shock protein beta-7-like [Cyprinodon variegatus]|uniref:Heat shock protein beta-7-like n=1 Tax=Cyprinodon variegatus TaxID=28743 RepID=A0A3Q2ECJ2_CYPVA|nr:PREDICTED: heat shock protein beta-7-like [Cyprinodon variegatus]